MRRVWLVTAAACTSVPKEPIFDRPPLITVSNDAGAFQVHGPGYTVGFGPEGMVRMPETIVIGSSPNLLENQACPFESLAGVALYPTMVAAATQQAVSSSIDRIADGPVIAKVGVSYDVASACAGTARHMTGTSFFTFFPTGRINREDRMVSPTLTEIPAGATCEECGAGSTQATEFFFTTYYNFSEGTYVTAAGTTAPGEPAPIQACALVTGGYTIGVAWRNDNPGIGPRIQNAAYIHDWERRQRGPLAPQQRTAFSDVVLPERTGASCGDVLQVAREVPLRIGGTEVPPGHDGVYRPMGSRRGTSELVMANPAADAAIAHGFAVSLDLGTPDHVSLRRDGTVTDRLRLQPDPDDPARTIVWFEDGIAPNETVTLEVD